MYKICTGYQAVIWDFSARIRLRRMQYALEVTYFHFTCTLQYTRCVAKKKKFGA